MEKFEFIEDVIKECYLIKSEVNCSFSFNYSSVERQFTIHLFDKDDLSKKLFLSFYSKDKTPIVSEDDYNYFLEKSLIFKDKFL